MVSISECVISFLKAFADETGKTIENIFTDILEGEPENMAVSPSSSVIVKRYFYGGRKIEKSFTVFLSEYSGANLERKQNTAFIEGLENWVNTQNAKKNLPDLGQNRICNGIEAANGMLYQLDQNNTGTYMIQLKVIYTERGR